MPSMTIDRVGYGAGDRDPADTPNVLRVMVGQSRDQPQNQTATEQIVVLECEIDDMNPQIFGSVMEQLVRRRRAGGVLRLGADEEEPAGHAADDPGEARATSGVVVDGVPRNDDDWRPLPRSHARAAGPGNLSVNTPLGAVRFKVARFGGSVVNAAPEFEDCQRIAVRARDSGQGRAGDRRRRRIWIKRAQAPGLKAQGPRFRAQGSRLRANQVSRFYITTPIYYVNAEPHLGHAYSTIVADAIARARRLRGEDVFFLTGTDEHGQKVERAAKAKGMTPRAFTDDVSESFRKLFRQLNITNDDFIRTTEPRHVRAAQHIWRTVRDNGFLYKATYQGWYCTVDEVFVPEAQLVDGRCPDCGNAVERLSEESYFFRLSAFQDRLLEHYDRHPEFLTPEIRMNEIASFVRAGLKDLSVSRTSFKWGIPVPDDPAHVMYVWFDALTNYLTAVGYPDDAARLTRYWPADVHLMGKEIIRQHAVYWPAFLMAAGLDLPRRIVGHGWWLMNDAKMSKSVGNVVRPQAYTDMFGVDAFRYFLLREATLGNDANFSDEAFVARYNADLANDLGNLASRATTMIHRYCEGVVPGSSAALEGRPEEARLSARVADVIRSTQTQMADSFAFSQALRDIWDLVSLTNKYIATREPWALAKDPQKTEELHTVLNQSANALRVAGALIEPVMPSTAFRIRQMLGIAAEGWTALGTERLKEGTRLGRVEPLFPRIEKSVEELRQMADQIEPPAPGGAPAPSVATAPADNRIAIDEFMKVELRVAKILAAEALPKSKKLLKLQVDLGREQRVIVAGIAEAYTPEALVGRTIVVVANLKPAKLMGVESNGMVLAASSDTGAPILLSVEGEPGMRVR